jgi:hypothetical protein
MTNAELALRLALLSSEISEQLENVLRRQDDIMKPADYDYLVRLVSTAEYRTNRFKEGMGIKSDQEVEAGKMFVAIQKMCEINEHLATTLKVVRMSSGWQLMSPETQTLVIEALEKQANLEDGNR